MFCRFEIIFLMVLEDGFLRLVVCLVKVLYREDCVKVGMVSSKFKKSVRIWSMGEYFKKKVPGIVFPGLVVRLD